MQLSLEKHILKFKKPAKTSRGEYIEKPSFLLHFHHEDIVTVGEAAPLVDLSPDGKVDYFSVFGSFLNREIQEKQIDEIQSFLLTYPALRFAFNCAIRKFYAQKSGDSFFKGKPNTWIKNDYTQGKSSIEINGLVWMNTINEMEYEAFEKINAGFKCIKFKVGAQDFDAECRLLEKIRNKYSPFSIEIRLDANGAFKNDETLEKLKELSRFEIHSLEQPIKAGQWEAMQEVCAKSPINIALDEELIGVNLHSINKLLSTIRPNYIVLKPTLLGGLDIADNWVSASEKMNIGWWSTSALEGNIGLSDIAQWASQYPLKLPQSLGTGSLFISNFEIQNKLESDQFFHLST